MSKILFVDARGFASPVVIYKNKAMVKPLGFGRGPVRPSEIILDLNDDKSITKSIREYHSIHLDMIETLQKSVLADQPCVTEQEDIPYHMADRLALFASEYCKAYGKDEKLRQLLLRVNGGSDGLFLWTYMAYVDREDQEFRQAIINQNDGSLALDYCLSMGADKDMAKVILDSGDTDYMLLYYRDVEEDPSMRKGIADSERTDVIADYCEIFDYDEEMTALLDKLRKEEA